jgi:hypothetical protein
MGQNLKKTNMLDIEDDRMFVIESAIKHKLGSREEIELYEELSLALELMEDDSFKVVGSGIGDGIDFSITTEYPNPLPDKVGQLFFGIRSDFDVKCKETNTYEDQDQKHFVFKLKKS